MKAAIAITMASLLLGTAALAEQDKSKEAKAKPTATKKVRPAKTTKYVDVTGSHIKRPVKDGKGTSDRPMGLTVIDPNAPENRGFSNPMEMLSRNPAMSAPPGWR